jgi:hypothetical protein
MDITTTRPGGGLGTGQSHLLAWALGDVDESALATSASGGKWKIETINKTDTTATLGLRERKETAEAILPTREYSQNDYPNMDADTVGTSIPVGFGVNKGAKATLIDATTNRFKFLDHGITAADAFYDGDQSPFTPNTIDLIDSEFTYAAWDGEAELYVDYTADLDNPADVAKELLTGAVRGANLPTSALDVSSAGKGFGIHGARKHYIKGTIPSTGAEVPIYQIGLHVSEPIEVRKLLDKIQEAAFGFIFIDYNNLWQFKPWLPVPGEGLEEITENLIVGELKPRITVADAKTKVIGKYRKNHSTGNYQREIHQDEELRQLRDQPAHKALIKELIISDRSGARNWAQKTVFMRGQPRRIFEFTATSELKLAEPGDYRRLVYPSQNIDEVVLIVRAGRKPGETTVKITCIDNFGFRDKVGYYTEDAPLAFPASLGGGSFSDWSDATTPEEKQWIKENWGIFHDDNGYIDELDPELSHRVSVYW